ncbi:hypothetical protein [Gellertiella hungarica]|uniref:Surface antigen n=1 Tax=Gellertiella hungarica TaxID=1572859 RepID=A0A7W6J6J3_9HYPH|nr:hypothetical protein [Gellertiella hungarica]MBB4065713.1 surface antigen [Gellertiella hungarica]
MSAFASSIRLARARLVVLPVAALLVSACTTTTPYLGKSLFSEAPPSPSARILAALDGGIVGTTEADLSDNDTKRALEAEYRTLEAAPAGQPVIWRGDDANGEVMAAAPYQVGTQNCRQYSHRIIASGKQLQARGSACRNNDGSWSLL